jgi:hypothetical protein
LVRGEGSGGINEAYLLKRGKFLVDHLIGSTSIALTIRESMLKKSPPKSKTLLIWSNWETLLIVVMITFLSKLYLQEDDVTLSQIIWTKMVLSLIFPEEIATFFKSSLFVVTRVSWFMTFAV